MGAKLRYGDKPCRHCRGTGVGPWHMAMGECFRCGPKNTAELPRKWFGLTIERDGRTFKAVVRSYDEAAAREDAADLNLWFADVCPRNAQGFAVFDDAELGLVSRWYHARPGDITRVVPITRKIAEDFANANDRAGRSTQVREVTKK